jgi:hypothetical protein
VVIEISILRLRAECGLRLLKMLILPVVGQARGGARIVSRERIGGLLKYYHPY